jgi:3-methylfumaryl-CoA hydratase
VSEGLAAPVLADAGFTSQVTAQIAYEHAALLAVTLDVEPSVLDGGALPLPWHWTCFLPDTATSGLGTDGHPRRRPEMAAFPQRMWVGGRVHSVRPLTIDEPARRTSRVVSTELKEGSTGRFWLVTVEHVVAQRDEVCIEEEQDLVLREPAKAAAPGGDVADAPEAEWVEECTADPALLFRYSALTFNAHRIHYDAPYATGVEGYPDLVVHGPLTATLLSELARARCGRPVVDISFRARVPLFANDRFWLTGSATGSATAELAAIRADGQTAMTLTATLS